MDSDGLVGLGSLGAAGRAVVRRVYEEAFEVWEREPFEELVDREDKGDARTLVMCEGAVPIGLATVSWPGVAGWSYLEYFAVDARLRSRGAGSRMWRALVERLPAHAPRMVLEIHDPAGAPAGSAERETHERRRRFYERVGAVPLPVSGYVMPELPDTGSGHPGLLLAWLPERRVPGGAECAALVRALHQASYGLPPDHPLTAAVLARQGSTRSV